MARAALGGESILQEALAGRTTSTQNGEAAALLGGGALHVRIQPIHF